MDTLFESQLVHHTPPLLSLECTDLPAAATVCGFLVVSGVFLFWWVFFFETI